MTFRSGFACFVGRPNAGKSTLTNALVGSKIVITSDKPQTTRHAVRGIVTRPDAQLVLVDTPGLHRPRTLLGERLNDVVRSTLADVDVSGSASPPTSAIGPGDRFIAHELRDVRAPLVAIVTKIDAVGRDRVAEQLLAVSELGEFADVVPVSASPARRWTSSRTCWSAICPRARCCTPTTSPPTTTSTSASPS